MFKITFKAVFLSNLKNMLRGIFKVFFSTPENNFHLQIWYSMIVYENIYRLKKFGGLKIICTELLPLKWIWSILKKMTSFKNVLFYVYFDIYLSKKAQQYIWVCFDALLVTILHEFISKIWCLITVFSEVCKTSTVTFFHTMKWQVKPWGMINYPYHMLVWYVK